MSNLIEAVIHKTWEKKFKYSKYEEPIIMSLTIEDLTKIKNTDGNKKVYVEENDGGTTVGGTIFVGQIDECENFCKKFKKTSKEWKKGYVDYYSSRKIKFGKKIKPELKRRILKIE